MFNLSDYDIDTILNVFDSFVKERNRLPRYNEMFLGLPIGKFYFKLYKIAKEGTELEDGSFVCKKHHLTKEEYKMLTDRSIGYKEPSFTWYQYFEYFKKFYEENNRYPSNYESYEGAKIGNWVITQRLIYNNGTKQKDGSIKYGTSTLTKEKIDILNDFGFAWSAFDVYLSLLKDYIKEYNVFPKNKTIYKDANLGAWISKNRTVFKLGKKEEDGSIIYKTTRLTKEQIKKLNEIGFIWELEKPEFVFNKNFELLKEYKESNSEDIVYKGLNIKTFSSQLRTTFTHGDEIKPGVYRYNHNSPLSFNDAIRLDSIGFDFITKNNYYKEIIKSKDDMNKKKRLLLLKMERLLCTKKEFNSKNDIEDVNKEYESLIYKNKR